MYVFQFGTKHYIQSYRCNTILQLQIAIGNDTVHILALNIGKGSYIRRLVCDSSTIKNFLRGILKWTSASFEKMKPRNKAY